MINPIFNKIRTDGVRPLPPDSRDFALGAVFNILPVSSVPMKDFVVSQPLSIKDQGDTDLCTAYAITGVSEDQEGMVLSPEWQFGKIKQLTGDIEEWGADLRSACKSAVKFGSIPTADAIIYLSQKKQYPPKRDFVANWQNWDIKLDDAALQFKKSSYFAIEPAPDLFDGIRAALWTFKDEKRSIAVGAKWRPEWTAAAGGIITTQYGEEGYGHAFKIFGQRIIYGKPYLMAQLSNGKDIGECGIFFFPREIINKELKFGAFMFKDIEPEEAKEHLAAGTKANAPWYRKLFIKIFGIIHI